MIKTIIFDLDGVLVEAKEIQDNKKIKVYDVENMWGLGTPEDLNFYLENKK